MWATIYGLMLKSKRAKDWAKKSLIHYYWQKWGNLGILIESRYAEEIVEAMKEAGLKKGKDFWVVAFA